MKQRISKKPKKMKDDQLTVLEPINASTVKEGTAQIEPQFICYRHGQKFVTAQSFKDLHKGLLQAEEMEEQLVSINFSMDGYPLDCIVQVNKALERVYGFTHAKERMTFFGANPPTRLNIKTGVKDSVHAVYGQMAPPAWEGGCLGMGVDMSNPLSLAINGVIKRKFEPAIKKVVELSQHLLRTESIYRGQAIKINLDYVETGQFHPTHSAPTFMDLSDEINIILPRKIEREIQTNVWGVIANPGYSRRNKIPIKRGVQFDGPPGCGKTLCSDKTARVCVEHGWTFLYLEAPLTTKTFLTALKMATLYGPSVCLVEDNDALFGRDRDKEMNTMLEAMDGVGAKNAEVITIFTTNYPERLNPAFRRSGRVNHEITLTKLDAEAAGRFVEYIAGEFLATDIDIESVGKAFDNLVPADIKNGIDQAKLHCGNRNPDVEEIVGLVTTDDLCVAAEVIQSKARRGTDEENVDKRSLRRIKTGLDELFPDKTNGDLKEIKRALDEVREMVANG